MSPDREQPEVRAIPVEWSCRTLSELTDPNRPIGYGIVQTGRPVLNGVKCVRVVDLVDGRIDEESLIKTSPEISEAYRRTQLRENDVLVALRGKVGAAALVPKTLEGSNLTRGVALLSRSPAFDGRFLAQFLASPLGKFEIERNLNGSALQELPISSLRKLLVPTPPKSEQVAVGTTLSEVDQFLSALDALIAKKRGLKQAAMQQLLTGEKRLVGFSGGWRTRALGDLADILGGSTPSTTNPSFWNGEISWCTPTDVSALQGGKYIRETARTITASGLKSCAANLIPAGSVIMTSRATIGECAINTVPLATNQGFKNFVPCESVSAEFLYYLLQTKTKEFVALCSGSTFLEIGKSQLRPFEVRVPEKDEQLAIAEALSIMDAEISALESRLAKAVTLKEAMMQQLLTGRIRLI